MIFRLPLLTLAPSDPDFCSAGISRHREDVELFCLRPTLPHLALSETARMDEGGTFADSFYIGRMAGLCSASEPKFAEGQSLSMLPNDKSRQLSALPDDHPNALRFFSRGTAFPGRGTSRVSS